MRGLLLMLLQTAALAAVPADVLNLTSFTLQTPYPSGGGVREVKWPALATYNDSTFYFSECAESPSGCVRFWVPETGAHTGGSTFPRSELRQNFDWSTPRAGSAETHYSVATLRVLDAGVKQSVCIGQIHADGISGHCSIIVELEWTAGSIVAHVRDEACTNKDFVVGAAKLGEVFSYNLSMVGDAVQVVTNSGRMAPYSYSVRGAPSAAPPSLLPALTFHKSPPFFSPLPTILPLCAFPPSGLRARATRQCTLRPARTCSPLEATRQWGALLSSPPSTRTTPPSKGASLYALSLSLYN